MALTQGKGNKCCLTCEYWGGPRTLTNVKMAQVDSPSTRGKCNAGMPADAIPGPAACSGHNCSKHRLWSRL